MAVVPLGTRALAIGANPSTFDGFNFRDDRAYMLKGILAIDNPSNVFSKLQIKTIINNTVHTSTYGHHNILLPIAPTPFVFLLPFSSLYQGNGTCQVEALRIPIIRNGSDEPGNVMLTLSYDDDADIRTWL